MTFSPTGQPAWRTTCGVGEREPWQVTERQGVRTVATYRMGRSVHINAPVADSFNYLKNPANMWTTFPKVKISDVHLTPDGVGSSDHFSMRSLGVIFERGTHEVVEVVPNEKLVLRSHPFGVRNGPLWTWTFSPEDGGTRVNLVVADDVPKVMVPLENLSEKMTDRSYSTWLNSIKANVEALAGVTG